MNAEIILELLNYTTAYVVVLDAEMKIKFASKSLITKLGFNDIAEILDMCWLEFIPSDIHGKIKSVHKTLLANPKDESEHNEFVNDVFDKTKNLFRVKWINTAINHSNNLTLSFGIPQNHTFESMTEDDIRNQFKSVIANDKATIRVLKEYVRELPNHFNLSKTCDLV